MSPNNKFYTENFIEIANYFVKILSFVNVTAIFFVIRQLRALRTADENFNFFPQILQLKKLKRRTSRITISREIRRCHWCSLKQTPKLKIPLKVEAVIQGFPQAPLRESPPLCPVKLTMQR